MGEEFEQGEAFNMGIATLMRFDKLLTFASAAAIQGQYYNWYQVLSQLKRNLRPFLKEEEYQSIVKLNSQMPPNCWMPGKHSMNPKPIHFAKIAWVLDELDMMMQMFMKDKGLLMPKKDDPSRALLGG